MREVLEVMRKYQQPYHELLVWQRADDFICLVYEATKSFPKEAITRY